MHRMQRQALILFVQNIESQIQALKAMIGFDDSDYIAVETAGKKPAAAVEGYTSEDEDARLEAALKPPVDEAEMTLQEMMKRALTNG